MKLKTVKIKNFRGYKEEAVIPIHNITAFIGKNDAGKSTILEALEIFFNNSLIICEQEDRNIYSDSTDIEITCVFSDLPASINIDATVDTSLEREFLLNQDGQLEIKKVFPATIAKPKEKVFIVCNHPTAEGCHDLLTLKRPELKKRAKDLGIDASSYDANVNSSIRQAIRDNFSDLAIADTNLLVDKEDTKKVYQSLFPYLPIFALFQSDRKSTDDDKEVIDPMKIAVQQALAEVEEELNEIKHRVQAKVEETANRTLEKLQEMSPDLASQLRPEFKSEPKFDSLFKLTFRSEDDISINKRGSGVRRLILLNFFRAEAERARVEKDKKNILLAFEEPETSQHPDHQKMLIQSFIELANSGNTQVLLTTHTPALAGLLPLESLRYIEKNGDDRNVQSGTEEVFQKIADTLGVLPEPIPHHVRALLLVEGKDDVIFMNHLADVLKASGAIEHTFSDKHFALVPVGGCGNLKHWRTKGLAAQFNIPYCVLLDSDKGGSGGQNNVEIIAKLRKQNIKAYTTRKRELENYIHPECIGEVNGKLLEISDVDDAKEVINQATKVRKSEIIENYWTSMTFEQIREVETYTEDGVDRYELTEMIEDYLSIVS